MKSIKPEIIAFYLPQFHAIPENDLAWGKGFTEWVNVKKAAPLFRGHSQPRVPTELGYYNLLDPWTQEAQSELAIKFGISCFSYWYYWMGNGKRLLEKPLDNMLRNSNIRIPFCLSWANESWTGIWHGKPDNCIAKQEYPGFLDLKSHATTLSKYFSDSRYFRVNDRHLFLIYKPFNLPPDYLRLLRVELQKQGFNPFIVAISQKIFDYKNAGYDGLNLNLLGQYRSNSNANYISRLKWKLKQKLFPNNAIKTVDYKSFTNNFSLVHKRIKDPFVFPTCVPNWDNSPRSGRSSLILSNSTPELYANHLAQCLSISSSNPFFPLTFIKSWNEWAEGNFLEPDVVYGRDYLIKTKQVLNDLK